MGDSSLIAGWVNIGFEDKNLFHRYTVPLGPVCDYYTEVGCHNCEETCAANNCPDLDCDTSTDCNCSDCKVDNDCPTGEQCCDRQCASSCGPTDPPATTTTTEKPTQPPTTTTTPCPTECCSDDDCEVSYSLALENIAKGWNLRKWGMRSPHDRYKPNHNYSNSSTLSYRVLLK